MAIFERTPKNIGYLTVTYDELMSYSRIPELVCDNCNNLLKHDELAVVIPVLNSAYCPTCTPDYMESVKDYPEDRAIRARREEFWCNFYGIEATV